MIVSFKHSFVFVAIPKTGTQSVRKALRPHLDGSDWEQCVYDDHRFFPVASLAALGHGHLSVGQLQPYLIPGLWQKMYSFAFVRNPFDRFASFCTFYQKDDEPMRRDPTGTMKAMISDAHLQTHPLMVPQHGFLSGAGEDCAVSFVGRYEHLQRDFSKICDRLGLSADALPHINASSREPLADHFDEELQDMVRAFYSEDFRQFGYDAAVPEYI